MAAVDAALAEGWPSPAEEILTDDQLIAAVQEIERLWREQARLYSAFNLEGRVAREDLDEVYRLWDRADELTEQALQAPVSTARGALAMLRLIRHQAFERDIDKWEELYPAAMDRVLAVLEGSHGSAKPGPQHWRF